MSNPWMDISSDDYENHMASIGQLQALNKAFKKALLIYKPRTMVILGSATGNGLEHINPLITKRVHAIDINEKFLQISLRRYGRSLPGLRIHCLDLGKDQINIPKVDFIFAGLIFEYIDVSVLMSKIEHLIWRSGIVLVILQLNLTDNGFVSQTNIHR